MLKFQPALAALALTVTLAGCGGGGGGSVVPAAQNINATPAPAATATPVPATPRPTVAPTATPIPIANTSVQSYMPFHVGNTWTFTNGSRMVDGGSGFVTCTCVINNYPIERIDLYNTAGYIGSQVLAKGNWPLSPLSGHRITYIVGTMAAQTGTINFIGYSSDGIVPGVPLIDDAPTAGEYFTFTPSGGSTITTTIPIVNDTQQLGSSIIDDVAFVGVSGQGLSIAYSFAQGVGFTGLGSNDSAIILSSFSVNPSSTTDHLVKPLSESAGIPGVSAPNGLSQAQAMFNALR